MTASPHAFALDGHFHYSGARRYLCAEGCQVDARCLLFWRRPVLARFDGMPSRTVTASGMFCRPVEPGDGLSLCKIVECSETEHACETSGWLRI